MATWQKENQTDKAIKLILFIISPFFSFLYSLKRMNTRSSYVVFFLFAVFFGMAFTVDSGKSKDNMFDSASYRAGFEYDYQHMDYLDYIDGLEEYLKFDEGKKDYYYDTVSFYVSRVTGNYHIFFMVIAMVFAYFMLKSLRFLTSEEVFSFSIASLILAYLFTINQIFNINGLRMWTAAWVAVYALLQILRNNNQRYYLLLFVTPFFHGSFWVLIGVVVLAQLLKRFEKAWIIIFIISFFVGNLAFELIEKANEHLPIFLQRLIASYTDPYYVQMRSEGGTGFSWVPKMFSMFTRVYINIMVYLFIKNSNTIKENLKTKNIYLFLLVYMTFINLTLPVPSLGGRFMVLAYPFIAYIWLVNFKDVKYQKYLYAMPFVFLWNFYEMFGHYTRVLSFDFYFSSPFLMIYKYLIAA